MSEEIELPEVVAGRISKATYEQMLDAKKKFGVTAGVLVRMALDAYMPSYLAAAGRPENIEFLATVGAAAQANDAVKPAVEKLLHTLARKTSKAA
jgi:hypothetical protein